MGSAALLGAPPATKASSVAAGPTCVHPGISGQTAIQGVCAWPNCQILEDGTILALIFNQPWHGIWEGDLDCWASRDGGLQWRLLGRVAPHEPGTNRMNCAAGIAGNGDVVVLCSGWADRGPQGTPAAPFSRPLRAWVCRSADGGARWSRSDGFPAPPPTGIGKGNELIPFGNIRTAEDGSLRVAAYLRRGNSRAAFLLSSTDDGRTWGSAAALNPTGNETDILHLGQGRWLAASREFRQRSDVHLELFRSTDDGRNWERRGPLTMPRQVTGHLTRLSDGRVLLTYGNRCWNNFGVDVRISDDDGLVWSPPVRLADCPRSDCGYPSTVQTAAGDAVTAFYTQISGDYHYEMRVARWNPAALSTSGEYRP